MAPTSTSVFVGERVIKPYELKTEDFPNLGQGYDFMTNEYKNKAKVKDVPSMVRTQENRTTAAWEYSTMEEMRSSTESYSASAKAKAKLFGTKLDLSMAASGSWTKGQSGEKICARSVQRVVLGQHEVEAFFENEDIYKENTYQEFLETYGTHFVKRVKIGGTLDIILVFDKDANESTEAAKRSAEVAVKGRLASGEAKGEHEKDSKGSSSMSKTKVNADIRGVKAEDVPPPTCLEEALEATKIFASKVNKQDAASLEFTIAPWSQATVAGKPFKSSKFKPTEGAQSVLDAFDRCDQKLLKSVLNLCDADEILYEIRNTEGDGYQWPSGKKIDTDQLTKLEGLQESVSQKKDKLKDILQQAIPDWKALAKEAETIFIPQMLKEAGLEEHKLPLLTSSLAGKGLVRAWAGYEWAALDSQTQKVPVGAVRVDPKEEVYVGKAWTRPQTQIAAVLFQSGSQDIGDEHICKFVNNGQSNFCVPYQGKEYNNMRLGHVLRCHSPDQEHVWVAVNNGKIPCQGVTIQAEGLKQYVGRARYEGVWVPGKVITQFNCIFIPWYGKEIKCETYEILKGEP